jgi:hypothetical protein
MRADRHKKFRAVTPYNGFHIKDKNTGWVRGMNIYTPKHDKGRYHNVLTNMRHSLNYVQDDSNFRDKFQGQLEKTGLDAVPVIAVREWETNPARRKKKFGYAEDSIIDYPDRRNRGERLAKTRSHSSMHPDLGDEVEDTGDSQWQQTHEEGKPWDFRQSQKYLKNSTKIKDRAHLWNSSYSCRFRKNRSTDAYLVKRDNSVMPAAGMWSQYKRPSGVYRRHVANKVREDTEKRIKEGMEKEFGKGAVKRNNFKIGQKNLRQSSSGYLKNDSNIGYEPMPEMNYGSFNEFEQREWKKRNKMLRKKMKDMVNNTTNSQKMQRRGKYSSDIFRTILSGPSKANVRKAIMSVRDQERMRKISFNS